MQRSKPAIENAIAVLGSDHNLSPKLYTFLHEVRSLHSLARKELQDCQQNHQNSQFIRSSAALATTNTPAAAAAPISAIMVPPPAPPVDELSDLFLMDPVSTTTSWGHHHKTNSNGKMLRFNRKEMDFVRNLKNNKVSISEISQSMIHEFPKWVDVDRERLLAKIRRVRKRKDDGEDDGSLGGGGYDEQQFTSEDDSGEIVVVPPRKKPRTSNNSDVSV